MNLFKRLNGARESTRLRVAGGVLWAADDHARHVRADGASTQERGDAARSRRDWRNEALYGRAEVLPDAGGRQEVDWRNVG